MAAEEFRNHLAQFPTDPAAHASLAICSLQLKELSDAEAHARQATSLAPDYPPAHRTLAYVFLERRRYSDALKSAKQAIALDSCDANSYAALARVHLGSAEFTKARSAINTALELDPSNTACANIRALILHVSNCPDDARAEALRSLSLNPENPHSHLVHGTILVDKGHAEEALGEFREALRVDPSNEAARAGVVSALRARSWFFRNLYRYKYWAENTSLPGKILIVIVTLAALFALSHFVPVLRFTVPLFVFGWFALMLLTWVADPVATLALRFNAYGRLALSRDERLASNFAAAMIIPSFICLLLAFSGGDSFAGPAVIFFLLVIPAYRIFHFEPGAHRWIMAGAFTVLFTLGGASAAHTIVRYFAPGWGTFGTIADTLAAAFVIGRYAHLLLFVHLLRAPR